jgi:hypothetical protein
MLAKQVLLYCLNHISGTFCCGYLEMGVSQLFTQAGLEL